MNSKIKGLIIAGIIFLLILTGFCGYGYISQKITANQGIEHLNKKEYQKAYEKFYQASEKFTLLWTKQKTNVLFYKGEALYQLERYDDAVKVYDKLIKKGESRAYSFKAFCYVGKGQEEKAKQICDEGIKEIPDAGDIYCTKYAIYAKQKKYKEGLNVLETALKQVNLKNEDEVMFTRISAYESMFQYDTAYKYAKEYVKKYPKDTRGKKELTFLETR
ncbi:hypothetical protein BHF70_03635 [Anaerostipes sp. 494a]|uniref:tetratricopeptide repeat protein n=1 Tax=Anaerostipes sp. 494a TaxID=1261636 RepID=UPI0009518BF5|nr:tetratricopeptide repeat protein [Anaerostipes sp. 494a]OLR58786.1 hypothetical protein BHF70_03635 [Anaerostipes sp. 494a]